MAGPAPLRVSIVSAYPCISAGLTSLVHREPERAVVVETPTRCSEVGSRVDVAICDIAVLRTAGAEGAQLLDGRLPVLVFARMGDATARTLRQVGQMGQMGQHPVAREDVTSGALLDALDRLTGRSSPDRDHARAQGGVLTPRETDVVRLIASGLSNEEIGRELVVGANSVKTYIRTAYKGMGVRSRTQAVLWAMRHGVVPAPSPEADRVPAPARRARAE
jgi:DNA-binding NarL/FixJ family response regulator